MTRPLSLATIARDPESLDALTPEQLVGIIAQAGALLVRKAGGTVPDDAECIDAKETAAILKLHVKTVVRLSRTNPRYRRLRVENGTSKPVFNKRRVMEFVRRTSG